MRTWTTCFVECSVARQTGRSWPHTLGGQSTRNLFASTVMRNVAKRPTASESAEHVAASSRTSQPHEPNGSGVRLLRTGCQWKAIPPELAPGSTAHDYFQQWAELGIFENLWSLAVEVYDELIGLDREWQSVDGAMTKAPLGGED